MRVRVKREGGEGDAEETMRKKTVLLILTSVVVLVSRTRTIVLFDE